MQAFFQKNTFSRELQEHMSSHNYAKRQTVAKVVPNLSRMGKP